MAGVYVLLTPPGAITRITDGSLKSCSVPMIEKSAVRMIAGRTIGTLMLRLIRHALAPSIRAASYNSLGTACSAVKMTIMLYPVQDQVTMFAVDQSTLPGERKSMPSSARSGLNDGMYRNDHRIAAITPGIA